MAKYPALPLFTDAYMADTRHLTTLQHGAYLLLLMTAWRMPDCALPNDDVFLARICGMDKRTWQKNRDVIMAFWRQDEKQRWYQGRLRDEQQFVAQLRNKNSEAGKASALKRLNRDSTSVQPESNQISTPTLTPTPIPLKVREREVAVAPLAPKIIHSKGSRLTPDWLLPDEWGEWAETQGLSREMIILEEDKFKDYWISQPGAKGVKADWQATWRNWIRRGVENGIQRSGQAATADRARF